MFAFGNFFGLRGQKREGGKGELFQKLRKQLSFSSFSLLTS